MEDSYALSASPELKVRNRRSFFTSVDLKMNDTYALSASAELKVRNCRSLLLLSCFSRLSLQSSCFMWPKEAHRGTLERPKEAQRRPKSIDDSLGSASPARVT